MPYIDSFRRSELVYKAEDDSEVLPRTVGELNFLITNLLTDYIQVKGLSYQTINDIVGALEGAKLEFYRRIAVPYEDEKIKQNGDVYT